MGQLEILLVRHAASTWNEEGVHQGQCWNEPGLSEMGIKQASCLADYFCNKPVLAIWTSPLPRALQTATAIYKSYFEYKIPLIPDHGLMEITHGIADGMHFSEIQKQFPEEWDGMKNRIWTDEPLFPGGESPVQATKRTLRTQFAIARIAHRFRCNSLQHDGIIVIVSHGAVNCLFLCEITSTPLSEGWDKFPQDNGCINRILWNDAKGEFTVQSVNEVSHLGDLRYTPLIEV